MIIIKYQAELPIIIYRSNVENIFYFIYNKQEGYEKNQ